VGTGDDPTSGTQYQMHLKELEIYHIIL